jgi:hypothetical protein
MLDLLIDADVSQYDITEYPVTGIFSGHPTARPLYDEAHWKLCVLKPMKIQITSHNERLIVEYFYSTKLG